MRVRFLLQFCSIILLMCRSQFPRRLRRRSAAARLLRSWVRIPPGAWMFVCCECCVLSGRGLCDKLITRPEESYRLCCVIVCDLETSRVRRPWPALGRSATAQKKKYIIIIIVYAVRRWPKRQCLALDCTCISIPVRLTGCFSTAFARDLRNVDSGQTSLTWQIEVDLTRCLAR